LGDRIDVPLELKGFDVVRSEVTDGVLEVVVRSTRRPACHHCGSLDVRIHQTNERRIRDRACSYPTVLRWLQRRLRCKDCRRSCRERHPEIAGRRSITVRFRRHIFKRAVLQPFAHVAATERVTAYRVLEAFEWHSGEELKVPLPSPPRFIAIDESSFKKRWRYVTVLYDLERGVPFEMFEGRQHADVMAGLGALTPQVREAITAVTMDLWWPYRQGVAAAFPNAIIVADKFHVLIALSRAANRVRRRCSKRAIPRSPRSGRPLSKTKFRRFDPEVWAAKWIFMKPAHKLSKTERVRLGRLFVRLPEIGIAWLMRESFAAIYDAPDRSEAERRLAVWEHNLDACGLNEFARVAHHINKWREPFLAYFDFPFTNGLAEGLGNKIKVLKRTAYGFTNMQRYRRKVLLACRHRGWA
jgi:transposase